MAELITMLVRFRTQAVAAVSATLAFSIESTIESVVSQILGEFIEKAADDRELTLALLPLDGARRLAGDVQHDAVHLWHLVGDPGGDPFSTS